MFRKRLVDGIQLLMPHAVRFIPDWTWLREVGNSTPVKLTVLIPLVGYLIIFNQALVHDWDLAREYVGAPTGAVSMKLPLIYVGLCMLAVGSVVYSLRCPDIVKRYPSSAAFVGGDGPSIGEYALGNIEEEIRQSSYLDELGRIRKRFETRPPMRDIDKEFDEQRRRIINAVLHLYFTVWNTSRPLARLFVSAPFLVGFSLLLIPSLQVFSRVVAILVGIEG